MGDNGAVSSPRTVAVLGSTGSIGTQALEVISRNPELFRVVALAAGSNLDLVAEQAVAFQVDLVAVATGTSEAVAEAIGAYAARAGRGELALRGGARGLSPRGSAYRPAVVVGDQAAVTAARCGADVVLNGITGAIGLRPTLAALEAGSTLALANKESLIVGGPLVKAAANPGQIVPVDSEHSAIAQCLRGGRAAEVRRLVLTASGGPFRGRSRESLHDVTPAEALAHPNFAMGRVVTTNSATLVNKGLEVIEAHLLFDVPFERIEVVVHPQQLIHSMVEFVDGSTLAQAGPPRMLVPIALGLSWPDRLPDVDVPVDWTQAQSWEFQPLDDEAFPAVRLARQVGSEGGTFPAVYNASNEVAVDAFHEGRIRFTAIVDTVARVVGEHTGGGIDSAGLGVEDVMRADSWARDRAREVLGLQHADGTHDRLVRR